MGGLDLPEKTKKCTSSRKKGEEDAETFPCGEAIESSAHIMGEREVYKEERDVLVEEMRKIDECDTKEFGTLDSSEKTIAILGDR